MKYQLNYKWSNIFRLSYILSKVLFVQSTFCLSYISSKTFRLITVLLTYLLVLLGLSNIWSKGYISLKEHYLKQLFFTFIETYIKYIMLQMML